MTSKTRRVMYKCVDCERGMPSEERVARKVRLWGKKVRKEYTEDVCTECAEASIVGKLTREAKTRSGSTPARGRPHTHDNTAA